MRQILALLLCGLVLAACAKAPPPPAGRWEGAYESDDTFIAARLEIGANGQVRVSAPDVTDSPTTGDSERAAMRQNMAERLAGGWGEVAPRPMDFDGKTFHLPGGIAPQMEWDAATKTMTLYVYLGAKAAIRIPLRPVSDFSDDPWPHA